MLGLVMLWIAFMACFAAVGALSALLGCSGRVWPASVEQASVCAEYADGTRTMSASP